MSDESQSQNLSNDKSLSTPLIWQCELNSRESQVTVGTLQDMVCRGEFLPQWQREKIAIQFDDEKMAYALHVLDVKNVDHQSLNLVVTSYKAGNFQSPVLTVTDGNNSVKVENLTWNVNSVLEGQDAKPIPSFGPFALAMPWWYWISLAVAALFVFLLITIKLKRLWDRKKMIENLAQRGTALTPFNQFNKDLRSHIKNWQQKELTVTPKEEQVWRRSLLVDVEKFLREYLMRELLVPALEWSDSQILQEIKKRRRLIYEELSQDIKKTMREIHQAQSAENNLTYVDCEQLVTMARKLAEDIYDLKQGRKQ